MVVDEDLVRVTAELAGVDKDDLEISLPDNCTLVIHGEKRSEQRKETFGELHVERHFDSFYRALPLPCEVVPEYVEAKFHRGVLTVDLPRVKDEQPDAPEPPAED